MYRKDKKQEFFTIKARKEGFPARSIYKLEEIDERFKIFKIGDRVLDLGCSPGSWLIYISRKVGVTGKVIGLDNQELSIKPGINTVFIKEDVRNYQAHDLDQKGKFNSVVSDLAPSTSGVKSLDAGRSLELCRVAFEIAKKYLIPEGNFVCKIFEGEESNEFIKEVGKNFKTIKRLRPRAVIKGSREFYIVAKDYQPNV